jgi:hypothetical protein
MYEAQNAKAASMQAVQSKSQSVSVSSSAAVAGNRLRSLQDAADAAMASSPLMQLRRIEQEGQTGNAHRWDAVASGLFVHAAGLSGAGTSCVAQRNPTEQGEGYFNGTKTLYALAGENGLFVSVRGAGVISSPSAV